jgi:ABC-type multidrug transport system ATPase subunit
MCDQPAIHTEGLSKRFGDVHALQDLNLSVPPGSVLGLLGPNGAGKTTTLCILTTLLRPDTGHAQVAGLDVVRRGRRLPHWPEAADRPVRTWSGGMRRRLDLAVSLVGHPRVLFLDESSGGLDPRGRRQLWQTIRRLVDAGTAVLLTTQYLEEADQLADQIVVIDRGRLLANGTPEQLKAQGRRRPPPAPPGHPHHRQPRRRVDGRPRQRPHAGGHRNRPDDRSHR